MEFIEFDSFQDDEIAQPQPALSISIPSNIETLSKRIPNLNGFKNLLNFEDKSSEPQTQTIASEKSVESDQSSEKYAQISLKIIDHDADSKEVPISAEYNLTTRLSKVLNNNINDKLVKEIFNLELNETELIDSSVMGSLSRKKLRSKIEVNLIKNQSVFLKEFSPMVKQFRSMDNKLTQLNKLSDTNNERLHDIFQDLEQFNKEFKALNEQKTLVSLKKNLLVNFKKKFILNEYEEFSISSNEVNEEFFKALVKLDAINEASSILLSIDNSNLGMNIMKKISNLIDRSNHTLSTFVKRSLIYPVWVNSDTKLKNFHNSVKFLKTRSPHSFDQVLQDFATDRSKSLIEDFNRQTEILGAHDPVRYIGDLLAYVHSMVINEIELMNSIFKVNEREMKHESFITQDDIKMFTECITILLDKIFDRLSRSIKSRFEQLISLELKIKVVYSIFNLFDLYKLMFEKNFTNSNSLTRTIRELISFTQLRLFDLTHNNLKSIKTSNSAQLDLNSDLQPPEWIIDFYSDVLPIVEQSNTTFDSVFGLDEERQAMFLSSIVNEPIDILNQHIKMKEFGSLEKIILRLNSIDLILSKILPINVFNDMVIELNDLIESLKEQAISQQLDSLLKMCKMYDFHNIINMILPFDDSFFDVSIYEPISENNTFNAQSINLINDSLSEYLPTAVIDIQNNLLKLNNPLISNDIGENLSLSFVKFYLKFNLIIEQYLDKKLIWSDTEAATLLGVEDAYGEIKKHLNMDL
ncbi:Golgi transport complex subunit 6 [Yamadazyma tenuis]|uniref:Conserved oligomeric Golgi complex subunit 6 n=1 Tax=Candida tenuis (strain ATCC 10573 / BCRC 21748 / CBS 615 / JCM 9827 / NBRC 10315 / NRRL Y-1498 / VKM Y-70) TaxID=590646 RepID=G3B3F3_CANTC|nr:COG complex subunit 6 [Yamadazyma tenuis ATCC 10573]EGV64152.1 COG complex subunit 6 [Yamadazyma tenuis ATCC 10573]WEJ96204.1 Golgi transport complex subunit 6 [Yamadazyma tenuis]